LLKKIREERYSRVPRCQIPVTQLKGSKGEGDMQAAKRDCNAPPTRDLNIWLCGRQTDLSAMGV